MYLNTIKIFLRTRGSRSSLDNLVTLWRYVHAKIHKFLKIADITTSMRDNAGVIFNLHPGCSISEKMYIVGMYDFDGMSFLLEDIGSTDTFYDIGANVGPFSLLASKNEASIYAFEGSPGTTNRLRENFVLNGIPPDRAINAVVTEKSGNVKFLNVLGSATNKVATTNDQGISVRSISIDDFGKQHDPPNYIKIDTEGHELNVFDGMRKTLNSGVVDYISFEANGLSSAKDLSAIYDLLSSNGFSVGSIDYRNKIFFAKSALGDRSKTGDYQAISENLRSRILVEGYKIVNEKQ